MRKRIAILTAALLLISGLYPSVFGAAKTVSVGLPSFSVTLNNTVIDNTARKYPLLLYKGITYFPMTYYDCRFLGVETKWKKETGLEVTKAGVPQSYKPEIGNKNAGRYTASIVNTPIKVNGSSIDNSKEEYPLLQFRNVTYFPLTYRFCAEEFDWEYGFNAAGGLFISEKTAMSQKPDTVVSEVTLPIVKREYMKPLLTMAGGYYYYEGKNGKIYQAPVSNPADAKEVYQMPMGEDEFGFSSAGLTTKNDQVILTYHVGGATMGSDFIIRLNADGTTEELASGKNYVEILGDYTIRIGRHVPPGGNNLSVKKTGEQDAAFRSLGETGYIYGWAVSRSQNSSSYAPVNDFFLIGEELYLLAAPCGEGGAGAKEDSRVYSVNRETGTVRQITKGYATTFQIQGDTLYFKTPEDKLYKKSMRFSEGGVLANREELLAEGVQFFAASGENVFYAKAENLIQAGELFKAGAPESLNPGGAVKSLEVQEGCIVAIFEEESVSPYKLMVLTKEGKVLYKSSEEVEGAIVKDGKLFFIKS